ncbi:uncharacterized protein LOC122374634 isoform X2 [Amphibalanus amphitrite]|uniref:uncharacterized protein LOC122374634 isoform X2 n=1 Tax=Amphibalanus amphitrite TaxID=1232801 RepID=UPI001C91BFBE|nr:uncharacterized protein LOC122374634 isoform X2 [Amphibalanus amphitrite]
MSQISGCLTSSCQCSVGTSCSGQSFGTSTKLLYTPTQAKGKLPEPWRLEWARQHQPSPGLEEFLQFLQREMNIREEAGFCSKRPTAQERGSPPTVSALAVSQSRVSPAPASVWTCAACTKYKHGLNKCFAYQRMSVEERWAVVRRAGLCYQCLGPHLVRQCKSRSCTVCGAAHHTSLHAAPAAALPAVPARVAAPPAASGHAAAAPQAHAHASALPAAPAPGAGMDPPAGKQPVYDVRQTWQPGYRWQHCSAAVSADCVGNDMHGQVCYNQTVLVDAVGPLGTKQVRVMIDGGSDSSFIRASVAEELGLAVLGQGTFACIGFPERVEEARTYDQVKVTLRSRHTGEGKELQFWKSDRLCAPVNDRKPDFLSLPSGVKLADDYQGGPVDLLIGLDQMYHVVLWNHVQVSPALRLIETIFGHVLHGAAPSQQQPARRHVYRCQTVEQMWTLDAVGVAQDEVSTCKPNFEEPTWVPAANRYEMSLLWKSDRRPVANLAVAESRTRRMTEKLTAEEFDEYDSHLANLRKTGVIEDAPIAEDRESAFYLPHHGVHRNGKLRVVYDGSAVDGSGYSLNSYLESGENLLSRVPAVLLYFRRGPVACQTDIQAAFHQILVRLEDRPYLQFFWLDRVLRFQRVPFGLKCSPYMLLQTVNTHLRYQSAEQDLCDKVRSGLYMDDICLTFSSKDEACRAMEKTRVIFQEAGMSLHKTRVTGDVCEDAPVLGLMWSTTRDELAVVVPESTCPVTKSQLLSALSRPFDPLGVLVPWIIRGKVLFQETWRTMPPGVWEERLPEALQAEVRAWWASARQLIWFPRPCTMTLSEEATYHVFCDASAVAFCAAVYAVQGGEAKLLIARSRLAPLSTQLTIPRLELMGALIGARLMDFVRKSLNMSSPTVYFWTDSMDVIYWISCGRPRKLFVENRVSAILQLSRADQWRHVRGEENPADLGTRGMSLESLAKSAMWWHGPKFIVDGVDTVDVLPVPAEPSADAIQELKPTKTGESRRVEACTVSRDSERPPTVSLFDVTECSSLKQAVNRYAWVLRFVDNARRPRAERVDSSQLTTEERRRALRLLIGEAQERHFGLELEALRACQPLPGTRVTLAVAAAEYMVRRRAVRRVVDTCTRCRRYRGLPYRSPEGALPTFRTQPARPFSKVGVDFMGPLYVDGHQKKVWILLITCATSRAVHLELVRSQASSDLIIALRRFFALRGTPILVYSDNARTFHALTGHLPHSVTWKFIPESAPWWGGYWERLVGVTKKALRITLHLCHLSFEELSVTLYELAFAINLRPLTQDDGENVLTPAHFLFGVTAINGVLCPSLNESPITRAWRHRRRVCDHLNRRWISEYLSALRCWSTSPRGRPSRVPGVGDVVLARDEGPRGGWPLARVAELLRGPDGQARAAVIVLRGRNTRRPVNKLYALEAAGE